MGQVIIVWKWTPEDFTYTGVTPILLINAEKAAGIVVACIPTYGPLKKLWHSGRNQAIELGRQQRFRLSGGRHVRLHGEPDHLREPSSDAQLSDSSKEFRKYEIGLVERERRSP